MDRAPWSLVLVPLAMWCITDAREVEEKAYAPSEAEAQAHAGALKVSAYPLPVSAVIYHSRQVHGRAGSSSRSVPRGVARGSRLLVRYHMLARPSVRRGCRMEVRSGDTCWVTQGNLGQWPAHAEVYARGTLDERPCFCPGTERCVSRDGRRHCCRLLCGWWHVGRR